MTNAPAHVSLLARHGVGHGQCGSAGLGGPTDVQILERVTSEYNEMPGLVLTIPQAMRLFGCDEATCRRVVAALVEARVLRFLCDGRLVRAD